MTFLAKSNSQVSFPTLTRHSTLTNFHSCQNFLHPYVRNRIYTTIALNHNNFNKNNNTTSIIATTNPINPALTPTLTNPTNLINSNTHYTSKRYNSNNSPNKRIRPSARKATSDNNDNSLTNNNDNNNKRPQSVYDKPSGTRKARKAGRIENIAGMEPINLEPRYKYISRRTALYSLLFYFLLSFGCLTYVYYHNLPPSRLMYVQPIMHHLVNPERAHIIAVKIAQWPKFIRRLLGMINRADKDETISIKLFENGHLNFPNPIGLAAGFDKHGECIDGMLDMGFGFVEIGSITPKPQLGNEKPRVFRLLKDKAIINRYGFNSHGFDMVKARLNLRIEKMDRSTGLLGINIGKNKETLEENAVNDYILGIETFIDVADYLVINVSSPNTPGLRDLQKREKLLQLLTKIKEARDKAHIDSFEASLMKTMVDCENCRPPAPPLLVKIAPDLNDNELEDIAYVVEKVGIDGIIVTNTTIKRPDFLKSKKKLTEQKGGLSGKPLLYDSNIILRKMYKLTKGEVVLIGVGGISNAKDAYSKIKCGASLVQLYSHLTYAGPVLMKRMIREIGQYAELDGFERLEDAIGCEVRREMGWAVKGDLTSEEKDLVKDIVPRFQNSVWGRWFGVIKEKFKLMTIGTMSAE